MSAAADEFRCEQEAVPQAAEQTGRSRRKRRWRQIKWTIRLAAILIVVGAFIVGFDGLFYYPSKKVYLTPDQLGFKYEEVTFETSDGLKLSGWFLPAQQPVKGTVVHFHGNAENITNHFVASCWLVRAGFNVFIFDYRGYGDSEGTITRAGSILDGHAAVDYLLTRSDVDAGRILAFGQSLGGAVATVVAAERDQIRAVVLDSTFSSYRRIASKHLQKVLFFEGLTKLIARAGLSGDYDPIDYVARIAPRPLLVIASTEDGTCFAELGRELFDAAVEPKEFILLSEGAHLESVCENVQDIQGQIIRFFERAVGLPS